MRRRLGWMLAPLLAVVMWLVLRDRGGPAARRPPVLASAPAGASTTTPARPHVPGAPAGGSAAAHASPPATGPAVATIADAGMTATGSPAPPQPRAIDPARPGPGVAQAGKDGAQGGGLVDRTGWNDASVARQLNKEFMPLASECIDQARARKPGLRGLLGFTMVVAPMEDGRAIVSSLQVRKDNQIDDPDLFECIRESSFALDGLSAPHDFDITMPIEPEG